MSLHRSDELASEPLHLRDYWQILRRRRWFAFGIFVLVAALGASRLLLVRPLYQGTAQLLIERPLPSVLGFEREARSGDVWEDFYQTQCRLLQSRLLARKVVERLRLTQDPEFSGEPAPAAGAAAEAGPRSTSPALEQAIDAFLARLRIEPLKNSQVLVLRFQSWRPALAAQAVNALAEVYIEQILAFRSRVSAEAGAWLNTETQEQSRKVEAAEEALRRLVEQEGLGNIEERRALLEQKLKDLGSALTAAKTRRLEKEAQFRQMQSAGNPEELSGVIASPLIQTLRTELAGLERQSAQLVAKGYLDEYPDVVKVRRQIEGTQQKIGLEAQRIVRGADHDYRTAAAQEQSLTAALEAATNEALELSRRSLKYDALKTDLEASKRLAENILARQKQTDVARDVPGSNVTLIDAAAVPHAPVRPRPIPDTLLSVALALGCAVLGAFVRDYLDGSVRQPSDVRRLGLPLLGVIAEGRRGRAQLILNGHRPEPFAEGYRALRSALGPADATRQGQTLLVTSTLPGEGKSLTAVNLALSLASTDERVLLVDADMRRPTLDALLQTARAPGLGEVLARRVPIAEAVKRVPGSRLKLLPSGTATGNPADLLAGAALRELLATLRASYDRIVLDTPPAGAMADALALAPLADGALVVAHCGKVSISELLHTLERLIQARAHVLGVVLNRARPDLHLYDHLPSFAPEAFSSGRLAAGRENGDDDPARRLS